MDTLYSRVQDKVWQIVQPDWMDEVPQWESKLWDLSIAITIVVSVFGVMASSIESVMLTHGNLLLTVELVTVIIFTIEYLVRFWASAADPRWDGNFRSRIGYVISPLSIIDLVAILPFYLALLVGDDIGQLLLSLNMLRLLKLGWYFPSFRFMGNVIWKKRSFFAASGFLAIIIVLFASVTLYALEQDIQPDKFGSIPHSMWWAVVTLTTVGYGDSFPITPPGKIIAGIVALCGIGIVCMPTAILAGEFAQLFKDEESKECESCAFESPNDANFCAKCGSKLAHK